MPFAFEKIPRISLSCMLVPVQYREYEYGLFTILIFKYRSFSYAVTSTKVPSKKVTTVVLGLTGVTPRQKLGWGVKPVSRIKICDFPCSVYDLTMQTFDILIKNKSKTIQGIVILLEIDKEDTSPSSRSARFSKPQIFVEMFRRNLQSSVWMRHVGAHLLCTNMAAGKWCNLLWLSI